MAPRPGIFRLIVACFLSDSDHGSGGDPDTVNRRSRSCGGSPAHYGDNAKLLLYLSFCMCTLRANSNFGLHFAFRSATRRAVRTFSSIRRLSSAITTRYMKTEATPAEEGELGWNVKLIFGGDVPGRTRSRAHATTYARFLFAAVILTERKYICQLGQYGNLPSSCRHRPARVLTFLCLPRTVLKRNHHPVATIRDVINNGRKKVYDEGLF